jgi:hypothetical protein
MKFKKLIPVVTVATLIGAISLTTAFAATSTTTKTAIKTTTKTEQKAKFPAPKQEVNTKLVSLTDAQKAEINALKEAGDLSETAIIDKYLEFGLIDQATATDMKAKIAERTAQPQEKGEAFMMGDKGPRGGMGGERVALTDEQKAQMKADLEARLKQEVADGKITQAKADEILANAGNVKMGRPEGERTALTDAQKAEFDARKQELDAKWASLTDVQKAEIYALKENVDKSETAIIDKYLEFGLIDEATATDLKAKIAERTAQMKEKGEMPMRGMGDKGPRGGMGGEKAALTDEQKAQMKADLETKLKQEVADGKITQAKADEILVNAESGKMMRPHGDRQKAN